ncbi:hypothetical protein OAK43_01115 [Verrucomicrobiales bacterium]|nr:hypothetical protein [Verrucomicrobiales bacterium]
MKLQLILTQIAVLMLGISQLHANYTSYQKNPDGTYVCGGAYTSYQKNPDGTYVCGGA